MDKLKVASAQLSIIDNDFDGNMKRVKEMVSLVMQENHVDLLLFPELCIEGADTDNFETGLSSDMIEKIDTFWRSMAKMSGIHLLVGRVGRPDGIWRNLATCYAPSGEVLAEYAKTHLYNNERAFFQPGDNHVIFNLKGFNIGIMICADLGFPEFSRVLALNGAEVFAVPSCWSFPHDDLWIMCNQMRAVENGCFMVSCNRFGSEKSGRFNAGNSMAVSPSGSIMSNIGFQQTGYFISTFDKEAIKDERTGIKWLEWVRPELYSQYKPKKN